MIIPSLLLTLSFTNWSIASSIFQLYNKPAAFLDTETLAFVVIFDNVLLLDDGKVTLGAPAIEGAAVTAKILKHLKGDKVIVFKKKRRKGYKVKNGHRQYLSEIQIENIVASGAKKAKKEEPKKETPKKVESKKEAKPKVAVTPKATAKKAPVKAAKADDLKKVNFNPFI